MTSPTTPTTVRKTVFSLIAEQVVRCRVGRYRRRPSGSWSGQKRAGQLLVDDHHRQRAGRVALLEEAPPDEPHAHRLEVARRDVDGSGEISDSPGFIG